MSRAFTSVLAALLLAFVALSTDVSAEYDPVADVERLNELRNAGDIYAALTFLTDDAT